MELQAFCQELNSRIAKYDLLCHPFYQAWSAGALTRDDLRQYAAQYYQHVAAFPSYLKSFLARVEEEPLRRAVAANLAEEEGHDELWLDFAEGMGAERVEPRASAPITEIAGLVAHFHRIASESTPAETLATFYAYESQVPRVAREKARGLSEMYAADEKTCGYFTLHTTADVYHSNVWRTQLTRLVANDEDMQQRALTAAENAARCLWQALDGIERQRRQRLAA